jgi:hypothetical protein
MRTTVLFLLLFSTLAICSETHGQSVQWRQSITKIRLLVHTYDDVIEILGEPSDGNSRRELAEYFETEYGQVFVEFGSGNCKVTPDPSGQAVGWRVPRWTVIHVGFIPKNSMTPQKLGFDIAEFEKYPVDDVPGSYSFENATTGISFTVGRDGNVSSITFLPPKSLSHLHC